jgi:protease-4
MIVLEGLAAELMYLKQMFHKIDERFEVMHVGEFKTAYEDLARDAMSEEQREVIGLLLDEFYGQLLGTIDTLRGMDRDVMEGLYVLVLVLPEDARRAGLIVAVAFADEFERQVDQTLGGVVERVENYGD